MIVYSIGLLLVVVYWLAAHGLVLKGCRVQTPVAGYPDFWTNFNKAFPYPRSSTLDVNRLKVSLEYKQTNKVSTRYVLAMF